MLHGLELSINSPGFSRASQWSRTFPAGVIPLPSEVFKTSRPGKEHGFRRAESRNRSLGRGAQPPASSPRGVPEAVAAVGAFWLLRWMCSTKEMMLLSTVSEQNGARRGGEGREEKPRPPTCTTQVLTQEHQFPGLSRALQRRGMLLTHP